MNRFLFKKAGFIVLLLCLIYKNNVYAQVDHRPSTAPIEQWTTPEPGVYLSLGDLLAALNAQQSAIFDACSARPVYSCTKIAYESVRPDPLFPLKINGNYIYFDVNAKQTSVTVDANGQGTSDTIDASDRYGIYRSLTCPNGFIADAVSDNANSRTITCITIEVPPMCKCGPDGGAPPDLGDPINSFNGIQTEVETDYSTTDGLLSINRQFRGQFLGWHMPGDIDVIDLISNVQPFYWTEIIKLNQLLKNNTIGSVTIAANYPFVPKNSGGEFRVINPNGSFTSYVPVSGTFPTDSSGDQLQILPNSTTEGAQWRLTRANNIIEEYGLDGKIRKRQFLNGRFVIYTYADGKLAEMHDNWGRKISFTHDPDGNLSKAILPDGLFITYGYQNGALSQVIYPDGKTRSYLYGEPNNIAGDAARFAMTGVIDENNKRITTFIFDSSQRAISTESANGVDKYSFQFGGNYTQIITPSGINCTYYFANINGRTGVSYTTQPKSVGCGAASGSYTYDTHGNVASSTDFNGVTTTYSYDLSRNLETSRVEASGTASARTITTAWHPTYRLPLQVNEPLRRTVYTYDANGNVLTKTEQATSDVNGSQGAAAAVVGSPRVWSTTYNTVGQVLTAIGPRTDIVDKTTYTYDTQGNLTSVTNAAGHITTLSNYDPNGRVGSITDPNGLVTTLTYTPRGWLSSRVTTGGGNTETTSYTYDGVGQMTQVTLPDNSKVNYTYDDAHRLTKITDSLGNSINYTLDNMGNRTTETVADASGNLSRNISRVYDALNRLQQITGAAQ